MRSAIVVSPARPGSGGLGGAAGAMALGLGERGFTVEVLGHSAAGSAALTRIVRELRSAPLEEELKRRRARREIPAAGWDLAYAMPGFLPPASSGARILHQATAHPRTAFERMRAARRAAGGGRGFLSARAVRMLEAELEAADLVRAESVAVRDDLVAHGVDPAKIVHAYPGVELDRFRPGSRAQELQVAFVGVLALWKGVDLLVDVEARLRGRARFAVVGGPVDRWSRRLVQGTPFVYESDVARVMGTSHVLLLPSATDGFGYVVLEALAAGCVPIVSDAVGAAEVVRSLHPDLVQPRERFAERVPELLDVLPLDELSRRGRTLAENFDRTAMARRAADALLARLG
jgi:glycosyltransferase involved in cell wall biosynthesis